MIKPIIFTLIITILYGNQPNFNLFHLSFDDFHIPGFVFDVDIDDDTVDVDIFAPALMFDGDIYSTVADTGGTPQLNI